MPNSEIVVSWIHKLAGMDYVSVTGDIWVTVPGRLTGVFLTGYDKLQ